MSTDELYSALWYAGRGTGVAVLVLLSICAGLGIAARSGRPLAGLPRFGLAAVHRNAGLMAMALLVAHVGTLLADPLAQLRLLDLVLPFGAAYRPLWVGLGTVGSDLLLAVIVTSLLRHRIGARGWRAVHLLTYAAWPVAVLHGLGSGSDAGRAWLQAVTVCGVLGVAAAVGWRVSDRFARPVARGKEQSWVS